MAAAMLALVAAACGGGEAMLEPEGRAVVVEVGGCPPSSGRTGSGVAVGDGLVLTVAHLVAQTEDVIVAVGGGSPTAAEVIRFDPGRDLALLRLPANGVPDVEVASAAAGDRGLIVGAAASGTVAFEVVRPVSLSIEEVLGDERSSRLGYEVDAPIATGDSGAGAYDGEGRLIGVVFAAGVDGASSWVTSSVEVEQFLRATGSTATAPGCAGE